MGMGPRKKDNDMRDRQGKCIPQPSKGPTMSNNDKAGNASDSGGGGTPDKQYTQKGPKYSGPNYPQPDKGVVPFSGKQQNGSLWSLIPKMPSSPNYKRNYAQEAAAESPERRKERAMRNAARRGFEAASVAAGNGPIPAGMDVDHRKPLSKGGTNAKSNLGLQRSSSNRSYPRTKTGAMRSKTDQGMVLDFYKEYR